MSKRYLEGVLQSYFMGMHQVYSPFQRYEKQQRESEVATASPVKLIGMLLEGATLFNKRAIVALEEKRVVNAHEFVARASKIVAYLYDCLNIEKGGEVAARLSKLYSFLLEQYVQFSKKPEIETLNSINNVLLIVYDGWKQVELHPDVGSDKKTV